jgi:hypothetical protein
VPHPRATNVRQSFRGVMPLGVDTAQCVRGTSRTCDPRWLGPGRTRGPLLATLAWRAAQTCQTWSVKERLGFLSFLFFKTTHPNEEGRVPLRRQCRGKTGLGMGASMAFAWQKDRRTDFLRPAFPRWRRCIRVAAALRRGKSQYDQPSSGTDALRCQMLARPPPWHWFPAESSPYKRRGLIQSISSFFLIESSIIYF